MHGIPNTFKFRLECRQRKARARDLEDYRSAPWLEQSPETAFVVLRTERNYYIYTYSKLCTACWLHHYCGIKSSVIELKQMGYKFNPYDTCVANRREPRSQHTIRFHVDDLMCSHVDKSQRQVRQIEQNVYGGYGEVKVVEAHSWLSRNHIWYLRELKSRYDQLWIRSSVMREKTQTNQNCWDPAADDLFQVGTENFWQKQDHKDLHHVNEGNVCNEGIDI
jgi:hypothetical protein